MKWTPEAEAALKKVPFFVRKRVRSRVEREASGEGKETVTLAEVKATQKRFLSGMASEVKGYRIETCFGPNGCPNRAFAGDSLLRRLETLLDREDLLFFLEERVGKDLKFHHEFRIALADCSNACSQPQIKDIGILGASIPVITQESCSRCEACVETCKEDAVVLCDDSRMPAIDMRKCLACGQCIQICPTGTIARETKGFRVLLGGKLGRHPQLGRELPGIYSEEEVLRIVAECIAFYKAHSTGGRRFAQILTLKDFEEFSTRHNGLSLV